MIPVWILLVIVWAHFGGDFIFQTDEMATKKSSSNMWLAFHVIVYTVIFGMWFMVATGHRAIVFALVNGAIHFIVDWFTSRATSKLWKANQRHWFFCMIGFDQGIHLTTLVLTYMWLMR